MKRQITIIVFLATTALCGIAYAAELQRTTIYNEMFGEKVERFSDGRVDCYVVVKGTASRDARAISCVVVR